MTIYLVGQAPSRTSDPSRPLRGPSGRNLAKWLGVVEDELFAACVAVNLIDAHPGSAGRGDRFPIRAAVGKATALLASTKPGDRILALGRGPALLIVGAASPPLAWRGLPAGQLAAYVPHPSGLNHWWNAPHNRDAAREFGRELLRRASADAVSSAA